MGTTFIFLALAVLAIAAAVAMVVSRNAIHSALFLILNMATLAVLYLLLNAPFLAMVQVTVYAGAIMVLFLFVIMLLGADQLRGPTAGGTRARVERSVAVILGAVLVVIFALVMFGDDGTAVATQPPVDSGPQAIGLALFEVYVLPFEVTSLLLLAAMVGVVVLSHTRKRGSHG